MKILVTGALGFIGRHLTEKLQQKGHEVIGVDFADGDLRTDGAADFLIRHHAPEEVIHLAAQVGIQFSEQDVVHAVNSNAIMTIRVAKACAKYGARMIHTSTSEVYGDMGDTVLDEDVPLTGKPTGIYCISKRWSEEAAREYAPEGLAIVRPSMPYGPGAPPGAGRRAMDNMLWQAHHRKPIIVHKGAVRSWCWVGDLCAGYELLVSKGATGIYNIGRDDDYRTMTEIAEWSCDLAGADFDLIREIEPPQKKTMVKKLSTQKIQALGWEPTIDLTEGMPVMYDWVKQYKWHE